MRTRTCRSTSCKDKSSNKTTTAADLQQTNKEILLAARAANLSYEKGGINTVLVSLLLFCEVIHEK